MNKFFRFLSIGLFFINLQIQSGEFVIPELSTDGKELSPHSKLRNLVNDLNKKLNKQVACLFCEKFKEICEDSIYMKNILNNTKTAYKNHNYEISDTNY